MSPTINYRINCSCDTIETIHGLDPDNLRSWWDLGRSGPCGGSTTIAGMIRNDQCIRCYLDGNRR